MHSVKSGRVPRAWAGSQPALQVHRGAVTAHQESAARAEMQGLVGSQTHAKGVGCSCSRTHRSLLSSGTCTFCSRAATLITHCHVPRTMPGTHWDPHGSCSREVRRQVGKRQNKDIIGAGREKSTRRGTRTSSHEEPVWMQPLASAGYLLAQHSHALEGDSPRPALPPRARQKLRAPKSRGDPPDSWQPANCICNPSLCGYKNAGSHLKRTH